MTEQQMNEMLQAQEAFKCAMIPGYKSDWPVAVGGIISSDIFPNSNEIYFTIVSSIDNLLTSENSTWSMKYGAIQPMQYLMKIGNCLFIQQIKQLLIFLIYIQE